MYKKLVMKKGALTTFLILKTFLFFGQNSGLEISGNIVSPANDPVPGAIITLIRASDQVMVKAEFSDDNGDFFFKDIEPQELQIIIEHPDFSFFQGTPFELSENLNMGPIPMNPRSSELDEVEIVVTKSFIEQRFDKTIINVDKSISNAGNTALEVLEKAPGLVIDQNDNISMRGRSGVIVMINGKQVPLSGSELANMLRGLSSNSVEKIELITNPSAKYEAAGSAGIIDIRLKKDNKIGTNGTLSSGFGMGEYFKTTQGIQLNHRGAKINVFGNYNYSNRDEFNHLDIYRQFLNGGEVTGGYDQQNRFKFNIESHNARIGADYNVSENSIIGIAAYGIVTNFERTNKNKSMVLDTQLQPQSYFTTKGESTNERPSGGVNLNFMTILDSIGKELSVDLDYVQYKNTDLQEYNTEYFNLDGENAQDSYILYGNLSGNLTIKSAKVDYSQPFPWIKGNLEAGAKSSIVEADNDLKFYDRSRGGDELDENISNHFLYEENINAAYLNLNSQREKFSFQLGLRVENTNAEGNQITTGENFSRNYTQLFPSGFVGYTMNDNHNFGLSLSRRIDRPTYNQLNPFKTFLDPSTYSAGNPYLDPELSYSIELTHTLNQKYVLKYSYTRTEDVIINVLSLDPEQEQVVVQTNMNLATLDYYGFTATLPLSVGKWFNSINNATLYYGLYRGNLAKTDLDNGIPAFNLNSNNNFKFSKDWSAEIIGTYRSREIYGFLDVEPMWTASIGIQKQFWDQKGTLKLNLSDAFNTGKIRATTELTGYTERFFQTRDSRVLNLNFTYRFGKSDLTPAKRRTGGAEEEKNRVG
ncbi:MAG: TonB-dependent receptor [Christiangramia sp.]|nr:TonB-dependent receptor [Christiangramia sp.]